MKGKKSSTKKDSVDDEETQQKAVIGLTWYIIIYNIKNFNLNSDNLYSSPLQFFN